MGESGRVLIVEGDQAARRNLEHVLTREGYRVAATDSGEASLAWLTDHDVDVVVRGLSDGVAEAERWLLRCRVLRPGAEALFVAAAGDSAGLARLTRHGRCRFIEKPIRLNALRAAVGEALRGREGEGNPPLPGDAPGQGEGRFRLVTRDSAMEALLAQARKVAGSDLPVLVTGETGTGKELLARLVHSSSPRREGPFVAINCGALSEELVGNELFGHVRGAFTGAAQNKPGLVEVAAGGTLFLDEIGEMPPIMQVKLLRVIQEKEVMRVGALHPTPVDVRVIAATNRPILEDAAAGRFRKDLFYRLNVIHLHLPPLKERRGDVSLLIAYFMRHFPPRPDSPTPQPQGIAPDALAVLEGYPFPGNVRELKNMVQRAMALGDGPEITLLDLPGELRGETPPILQQRDGRFLTLEEMEREYLLWVCRQVGENHSLAAQALGIDRVSLWRRLKKIQRPAPSPEEPPSNLIRLVGGEGE
ncbi:MAG: sigma-54-dependent Fis family transcriptional regulator [Magnetococcales bacterium]|nr:sigma-54-dependent Fis family transcriptional regulator [Magnetococcales bacterium]